MPKKKEKRFQHNLYMFKPNATSALECLNQSALDLLSNPKRAIGATDLPILGNGSLAVVFRSFSPKPPWSDEWEKVAGYPPNFDTSSSSGLLLFSEEGNYFALTFGMSFIYLDKRRLEHDFGLYAAVNYLVDGELKGIEHNHMGVAQRGARQSAFTARIGDFGVNDALDLVRKISGAPKREEKKSRKKSEPTVEELTQLLDDFLENGDADQQSPDADTPDKMFQHTDHFRGRFVGATSANFGSLYDVTKAKLLARSVRDLAKSKKYEDTPLRIIDKLAPERDPDIIGSLMAAAVSLIKSGNSELEIAIPEIVGTNQDVSFVILRGAGDEKPHPDINLEVYTELLGETLSDLDVPTFESHRLDSYSINGSPRGKEHLSDCLIGTVTIGDQRYATNDGGWFRVDHQFKMEIDKNYLDRLTQIECPFPPLKLAQGKYKKAKSTTSGYEPEADYIEATCKSLGLLKMDQEFIPQPSQGGVGIEVCDILDWDRRALIHIKKNSRRSSVLSHFFRQGVTSTKLLESDDEFRARFREHLASRGYGEQAKLFAKNLRDWTVEFWIADTPKGEEHNIPFFSRISFKDCYANIRSAVADVKLGYIELEKPPETDA